MKKPGEFSPGFFVCREQKIPSISLKGKTKKNYVWLIYQLPTWESV
jgi:hypothetical protein